MSSSSAYFHELREQTTGGWNRFWFHPCDPATLGLIRILAGAMLFYTHCVWLLDMDAFFGPHSWLDRNALAAPGPQSFAWSFHWLCTSRWAVWGVHCLALVVFALLTVGLFSRAVSILAWLATVSFANRVPLALFGLDQINGLLAMYLMLGPSGAAFSIDRWLARRKAGGRSFPARDSVSANIAIRLIQVHLCVLYLAAGLSKLQGPAWWNGTALWYAAANLEYQSIDMTWLAGWPLLVNLLTHISLAWEISYCALIWPRMTRPLVLFLAIPLHLGIALCLGMTTFGLVMLIANTAFVSPALVRRCLAAVARAAIGVGFRLEVAERDPQDRVILPSQNQQRHVIPYRKNAS